MLRSVALLVVLLLTAIPVARAQEAGTCVNELSIEADHDNAIVRLSWPAVPGATFYDIHLARDGDESEHLATVPASQTLFVHDPAPEGVLDYRVAADGHPTLECFAASVHIGGNPIPPDDPVCVGGVVGRALPDGGVELMWPRIPGALSYDVLRAGPGEALAPLAFVPADRTSFVDTTAEPGVPFRYTVNANGLVPPGTRCEEVTVIAVPEFPHILVAAGVGVVAAIGLVIVRRRGRV